MRAMVLNLYKNLGISSVDNYLNVRDQPSEDGNIIGKMTEQVCRRDSGDERGRRLV